MRIYIGHSTAFNYQQSLYLPLKSSGLWQQHLFILPHDEQSDPINTKAIISGADLVIAEVSYPSTGLGIELGWANNANRPILSLYQEHTKPSSSLNLICDHFIQYSDLDNLISKLAHWLNER